MSGLSWKKDGNDVLIENSVTLIRIIISYNYNCVVGYHYKYKWRIQLNQPPHYQN
jgi:hypothetical protein